jgi:glyoxylase-like metal-dependent hydrolase (beta-lactamase superfamily II)
MPKFLPFRLAAPVALVFAAHASAQSPDFSKVEIKSEVIAPGVAVLFATGGNVLGGNIGVSYGPDSTVLIDDQFAPLTDKINEAVAKLGASPVRFLVNTHWHFDHSGGNENLGKAEATIFAHDSVRGRLAAGGTTIGNVIPPAPAVALPVVTYAHGLTFHLNGDDIDAVFTGGGHTDGDTVVFWRNANVVHMGDLMMNGLSLPFIDLESGGNAVHLVATLDQVLARTNPSTKVIPGHGPVTDQAGLRAWRDMIAGAVETVRAARSKNQKLAEFLKTNPLKAKEIPGGFISADQFATAIWHSLDAKMPGHAHKH